MNSRIYAGTLTHARLGAVEHRFAYPAVLFGIDLDELPSLPSVSRLFGYNQRRPVTLRDSDYGGPGPGSIRAKVMKLLDGCSAGLPVGRVELVTMPRLFGYAFNPVSFYLARDTSGALVRCVAEVNNTFGERHFYLLDEPARDPHGRGVSFRASKAFHVSPFYDRDGHYEFHIVDNGRLDIRVELHRGGTLAFWARIEGNPVPFSGPALRRALVRYPAYVLLTTPRILIQAAHLYFRRRLPVFTKPVPASAMTIQVARPSLRQRIAMAATMRFLRRLDRGRLDILLPDGTATTIAGRKTGTHATLQVRDYDAFWRILRSGDVGFGEAYMDGLWESPDVTSLIRLFIENMDTWNDPIFRIPSPARWINRLRHLRHANTRSRSHENIRSHYDLGDNLYRAFLDPSMTYSCALFRRPGESLEVAQQNKLEVMMRKADLRPGHEVLEIGSGWGGFAIRAATETGCRVTTLTLSENQLQEVTRRAESAGVANLVHPRLLDYRDMTGRFDRIVSIEMLEAVGHENFGAWFAKLDELLKPGGRVAIQVISIADQRYDEYRRGCDWIQKHIFPGGHLPSLSALTSAMKNRSRFVVDSLEDIGEHYALTLREWLGRFRSSRRQLEELGMTDRFFRTWEYYFQYCEAGFATRTLGVLQMVLRRHTEPAA